MARGPLQPRGKKGMHVVSSAAVAVAVPASVMATCFDTLKHTFAVAVVIFLLKMVL